MDKSSKKSPVKNTPKPSQKPFLFPKPKDLYKSNSKGVSTSDNRNANGSSEFVNNSDDELPHKIERSLSDGSVKSLSWIGSEGNNVNASDHLPVKRTRSNTTNKELWVLPSTPNTSIKDEPKKPTSPEPVKPPRPKRENSFKHDNKTTTSPDKDPVKPPRRKLPHPPNKDPTVEKGAEKKVSKDEEHRDVVSKPVVTSTAFQKSMTYDDNSADGRRVFSIYDDTADSGVQQAHSFYDLLYSEKGALKAGAVSGTQIKDHVDDNIYDEVPLDSSSQSLESVGKRASSNSFGIYDEVIVSKGKEMIQTSHTILER